MKTRFSTVDLATSVLEIRESLLGLRVANIYDIDNKTYLIKLAKPDVKATILIESGNRLHKTEFEWPKSAFPSGFSMKLRKHLRTRRLEKITQLGVDRIVDLQFGSVEAAYHVIVELYDRGNIVLTDFEYNILNILRPRTDESQDVRFAVREKYPIDIAKQYHAVQEESLKTIVDGGKDGDHLKRVLNPHLPYGLAVIEHCLLSAGINENAKIGSGFDRHEDLHKLTSAMMSADEMLMSFISSPCKGYIIQKMEKKAKVEPGDEDHIVTYNEFHPYLFKQHETTSYIEFADFTTAIDEFFSKLSSQKLDLKVIQQEKTALKKLDNVKKDHEKRLDALQREQCSDVRLASLIETNLDLVDRALTIVRSFIANQISWLDISEIIKEAQIQGDPVALAIKDLKLDTNHIVLSLRLPYDEEEEEGEEGGDEDDEKSGKKSSSKKRHLGDKVEIDLGLSAYANATKYYDLKRTASSKEQKTIDASAKALKSAKRKTQQTLKDVATVANINKARKTYWFEKFLWFISSENYLVIAGRDQQQNEMIWKRYLKAGDVYVHADLHGACSVVVKNPTKLPVGPKTLTEAGVMAVCHSMAWDARIVTSAWWVNPEQVTKTAPSGEYLSTGSFMIRGKKNYLPPCHLVYGFGFLFKVDEDSIFRHLGERKIRQNDEEEASTVADDNEEDFTEIAEDSTETPEGHQDTTEDHGAPDDTDKTELEEDSSDIDTATKELEIVTIEGDNIENEAFSQADESLQADDVTDSSDDVTAQNDDEVKFPDTEIAVKYLGGDQYEMETHVADEMTSDVTSSEATAISISSQKSRKQKKDDKKQKRSESKREDEDELALKKDDVSESVGDVPVVCSKPQQAPLKRGQKAKLKKMKDKYGDQDDEERQLKMEILMSAGAKKEDKKKKNIQIQKVKRPASAANKWRQPRAEKAQIFQDDSTAPLEGKDETGMDSDEERQALLEEENLNAEDADVLDTLTGCPIGDDTLLFAIPVCAPYSTMTNYKYKVKLTPGTTKRGKASKTAFNMFTSDKSTTGREKDLLRAVKDVDYSRNFPGKVKVSAPNLHKKKGR